MYQDPLTSELYSEDELRRLAKAHLAHNYAPPDEVIFVDGYGCWLVDTKGKRYLDGNACYSAVPMGHKLGELPIIPRSLHHPERILMAKDLAEFCGGELDMVLPTNGGTETYDTALKLVRKWGHRPHGNIPEDEAEVIVMTNNFHGRTLAAISASSAHQYRQGFGPLLKGIIQIPFGNINALKRALTINTAAVIIEPIQGEGGIIIPPEGYLGAARDLCHRHDILFVLDEVQTGFGRTGERFAFDHEGEAEPDVLLLGKAVAGGFPAVSAVVANHSIMSVFEPGDHGSTFGGNPVASRHTREFLIDFKRHNLAKNSRVMGLFLLENLKRIAEKSPYVKEVRGRGLFIGIELKEDKGMNASELARYLLEEQVVTVPAKQHILRFTPPLTITIRECDFALDAFERILAVAF